MSIIVSQDGKGARRIERTVIQKEAYLQQYIHDHPDTLPLQELKDDLKLLVLLREFPTGSGPIDALAVDADGDIYLIETKLYKNPDKRQVIAQILDYGASLWRAAENPESFIERLDELLTIRFQTTLASKVSTYYELEGPALTQFTDSLKQSVAGGRFRFVVLMDRLDERLKDLISFINANSNFDILGVGLDFYQHDGLDILIPTLFGAEAKKTTSSGTLGARRKWDRETFLADAESRNDPATMIALRELLVWCDVHADEVTWGSGARTGSFSAKFSRIDPRSVFGVFSNGNLVLNFKWLNSTERSVEWARQFGDQLRNQGMLPLPIDFKDRFVTLQSDLWKSSVSSLVMALEQRLAAIETD
jgi:hypothetical protein